MTPGQLVKAVAIALDIPEETVTQHDRNLVVAGLRTTGARGRNAPDVTSLDAARLMVASLAAIRVEDSGWDSANIPEGDSATRSIHVRNS